MASLDDSDLWRRASIIRSSDPIQSSADRTTTRPVCQTLSSQRDKASRTFLMTFETQLWMSPWFFFVVFLGAIWKRSIPQEGHCRQFWGGAFTRHSTSCNSCSLPDAIWTQFGEEDNWCGRFPLHASLVLAF